MKIEDFDKLDGEKIIFYHRARENITLKKKMIKPIVLILIGTMISALFLIIYFIFSIFNYFGKIEAMIIMIIGVISLIFCLGVLSYFLIEIFTKEHENIYFSHR